MADEKITPEQTDSVEEREYSSMSDKELYELIIAESKKYVEQTKDGDIAPEEYMASEKFTATRIMNLFFAFEYFVRTEHGRNGAYGNVIEEAPQSATLYAMVLDSIRTGTGMELYGAEYILQ